MGYVDSLVGELQLNLQTITTTVLLILFWWSRGPRNLPSGPWRLPIIGCLPSLAVDMYRSGLDPGPFFQQLSKKYGKIFRLEVLGIRVIVLNGYKCTKEAFQNPLLNDRPTCAFDAEMNMESGISFSCGESWRQQLHFTMNTLRELGVGKRSFEDQITTETMALLEEFSLQKGQGNAFDPRHLLGNAVSNVICSVVFGKRYNYTDEEFKQFLKLLNQMVEISGSGGAHFLFPIAKYLQPKMHDTVKNMRVEQIEFMRKVVDEHRHGHDPDNPVDYIDFFLTAMMKQQGEGRKSYLNMETLVLTLVDLFGAGTETVTTTLQWSLLYMLEYPDIQRCVQQEIDDVVGRNRLPRLSDKSNLCFTEATLLEIQRITSVSPLGTIHRASDDTTLEGFDIPKGTFLMSNLWAIHHDPEVWKEPSLFKPSRFLDKGGKVLHRPELIPFSVGRRVCLGENLAKMELYLFFTHLLHRFAFTKEHESVPLSLEGVTGITYTPKDFKIVITHRE